MKRRDALAVGLAIAGAAGVPARAASPRPLAPDPGRYGELTFRDEFDGDRLDTSKWNTHIWYHGPNTLDNVRVRNGSLQMRALRDEHGEFWWWGPGDSGNRRNVGTRAERVYNRTLDTDGKFYQTYGFFEMKAKMPRGAGPWPGFWLYNHDRSGRPEIDIVEVYTHVKGAEVGWGTGGAGGHPNNYDTNATDGYGTGYNDNVKLTTRLYKWHELPHLDRDWHTYGLHWDANGIEFFFDGRSVGGRRTTDAPVAGLKGRMYIIVDYWLGAASGVPSEWDAKLLEDWSNCMDVQHVRAWALADGSTVIG